MEPERTVQFAARRDRQSSAIAALFVCAVLAAMAGCSKSDAPPARIDRAQPVSTEAEVERGAKLFAANCRRCHGEAGTGSDSGPPLVHKIYEPNHHPDMAFYRAAAQGVRAHHWRFGDMPKVEGVSPDEVGAIIAYVRALQRQAGIY